MKKLLLALGLGAVLPLRGAAALEVSLEENKAERGNIGFVDMTKLFRLYPETQKAKQNFEEVLRQAEDQVNLRKAELIGLRAEIIKLRMERDVAVKLSAGVPNPNTSVNLGASTATVAGSTVAASVAGSTTTVDGSTTTTSAAPATGSPDAVSPLIINLPGLTSEPITIQAPSGAVAASIAELDGRIAERTKMLQDKDGEFKTFQSQVEKNLLELEGKKTEILLGKIYGAVREVAREEGVSVVIDKSQILFGHTAMDLTDKVLKKLRSS